MRINLFIVLLMGTLVNTVSVSEPMNSAKVEQSIDGAMQLFEAQRKERMAVGLKAMAKVLPYLFMGPMGIDSRKVLFKRIEDVEEASRFASVMAVMHRD